MAGITLEDFSQSVAYREIFGLGEQRGLEKGLEQGRAQGLEKGLEQGLKTGELEITLRQLRRRCGALTLDFQGVADLEAWLAAHG